MTSNIDILSKSVKVRHLLRPIKRSTTKAGLIDRLEELRRAFIKEVEEHRLTVIQCQFLTWERDDLLKCFAALEEQKEKNCKLLLNLQQTNGQSTTNPMAKDDSLKPALGLHVKREEDIETPCKVDYGTRATQSYPLALIDGIPETSRNTTTTNTATDVHFSEHLPFMLRTELQDIASTMGLPKDGSKADLIDRIKTYLDTYPSIRQTNPISGLGWDHPSQTTMTVRTAATPAPNSQFVAMTQTYTPYTQQATCCSFSTSCPTYSATGPNSYYPPPLPFVEPRLDSRSNLCQYCYWTPHGYMCRYP